MRFAQIIGDKLRIATKIHTPDGNVYDANEEGVVAPPGYTLIKGDGSEEIPEEILNYSEDGFLRKNKKELVLMLRSAGKSKNDVMTALSQIPNTEVKELMKIYFEDTFLFSRSDQEMDKLRQELNFSVSAFDTLWTGT